MRGNTQGGWRRYGFHGRARMSTLPAAADASLDGIYRCLLLLADEARELGHDDVAQAIDDAGDVAKDARHSID